MNPRGVKPTKGKPVNPSESHPDHPVQDNVTLSPENRVKRREGVVLRHVAGEHMLVPTMTRMVDLENMFLLNATGARVWELLDGVKQISGLCQLVADVFSLEPAVARTDVTAFLENMLQSNLVEIV